MFISLNVLGSLVLDVNSNRLDVTFVNTNGVTQDYFTMIKAGPGPMAPTAPSGVAATTVSSSEISLMWTDNSSNEDGFKIERSTDGINFSQFANVGANVINGLDNNLAPATTYYYRLRAFNAAGDADYSNVASAATTPDQPELERQLR